MSQLFTGYLPNSFQLCVSWARHLKIEVHAAPMRLLFKKEHGNVYSTIFTCYVPPETVQKIMKSNTVIILVTMCKKYILVNTKNVKDIYHYLY